MCSDISITEYNINNHYTFKILGDNQYIYIRFYNNYHKLLDIY